MFFVFEFRQKTGLNKDFCFADSEEAHTIINIKKMLKNSNIYITNYKLYIINNIISASNISIII